MIRRLGITSAATTMLAGLFLALPQTHAASRPAPAGAPQTVLLDGTRLAQIKQQLAGGGTPGERAALSALESSANAALSAGPWSVMDKKQTPPSGDKHDYLSQAPYWWPTKPKTPSNPYGCPYVQRDGQRYPGADAISDHAERGTAWSAIHDLALGWYYTGRGDYAQRAELDVRAWFLNPATAMNPNMDFAQGIPCMATGRPEGIIESSEQITDVLDALALLDSGAPGWSAADHAGIQSWFTRYLNWMRTSSLGVQESAAKNNHGSWKDQQDAAIAVYLGQTSTATSIASGAETKRIAVQIKADGSQPYELARTRSWHYSNFNATALCRLTEVGRHVGVNLWTYTAPGGGNLDKAIDYLIPAAEKGASAWPHQEIGTFDRTLAFYGLHAAAAEDSDAKAAAALAHVPASGGTDLWPIEPACL